MIQRTFRVKPNDTLPYTGWLDSTREDLAKIEAKLGFTEGAEIGVAKGEHAKLLCDTIPGLHLRLVDPWVAYGRVKQSIADSRFESAVKRLDGCNVTWNRRLSMDAVRDVADGSLDFVYIDGRHDFESVIMDLAKWAPKVRAGGIIGGHDYYEFYQAGVIPAVRAYVQARDIREWYVTKEKEASWFWVQTT